MWHGVPQAAGHCSSELTHIAYADHRHHQHVGAPVSWSITADKLHHGDPGQELGQRPPMNASIQHRVEDRRRRGLSSPTWPGGTGGSTRRAVACTREGPALAANRSTIGSAPPCTSQGWTLPDRWGTMADEATPPKLGRAQASGAMKENEPQGMFGSAFSTPTGKGPSDGSRGGLYLAFRQERVTARQCSTAQAGLPGAFLSHTHSGHCAQGLRACWRRRRSRARCRPHGRSPQPLRLPAPPTRAATPRRRGAHPPLPAASRA